MPIDLDRRTRPLDIVVCAALGLVLLAALLSPANLANGGKAKLLQLQASVLDNGKWICEMTSDVDPYLFALNSVKGKYKVLRVKIVNHGDKPIKLSAAKDHADVVFGETTVPGVLDFAATETALWDGLPQKLRHDVGFPTLVEPGEEESLFVFIAGADRTDVPTAIRLSIAGLGDKPIELREPKTGAKL